MSRVGSGHEGFAFPKGAIRRDEKAQSDRDHAKRRRDVVYQVYRRDGYRCRACGQRRPLHPHEIVFRSQGGDDLDSANILSLCAGVDRCHRLAHDHRLTITLVTTANDPHGVTFKKVR